MDNQILRTFLFSIMLTFCFGKLVASEPENATAIEQKVLGLWLYTGLTTPEGKDMPLSGIFLFKDGFFMQYAEFDGEPIKDQRAMAHAGPFSVSGEFIHMFAEQTISTVPLESKPYRVRGLTEHHTTVRRVGKDLTLVFSKGTGTVQNLEQVGSGSGTVYKLQNGALALVDGYFILVSGDENSSDAGYGRYEKKQDTITLMINRWSRADQSQATNLYDISIKGTFDGKSLSLEDGRSFRVIP